MLGELGISPEERQKAIQWSVGCSWNAAIPASVGSSVIRAALEWPENIAVIDRNGSFTYADLVRRSGEIYGAIASRGVHSGQIVAAVGGRSMDTIAVFLALEALGACYLPIPERWPVQRMADVMDRSGAALLVDYSSSVREDEPRNEHAARAADALGLEVLLASEAERLRDGAWHLGLDRDLQSEIRYCIFTSGSTGAPKGALVEQLGMMNHLWAKVIELNLNGGDRVAFTAPLGFDISIWQMLAPLLVGCSVVVVGDDEILFPRKLANRLASTSSTTVELVPTLIQWLVREAEAKGTGPFSSIRWLISTGEELSPGLAGRVLGALPHVTLMNAYGPTECSDDVTHHVVGRSDTECTRIPVGRPIMGSRLYLLEHDPDDGSWNAVEPGAPGELFVGGAVVGRGYVNAPGITARAFFRDVLDESSQTGRLYRTGDLAKVENRTIRFLGRVDRQVKINGVRIELDEVETVIGSHPHVDQCAALVTNDGSRASLELYYSSASSISSETLHAFAADRLSSDMVPKSYHLLPSIPLNANGKIDHRSLKSLSEGRKPTPTES